MNGGCKDRQHVRFADYENFRNALAFLTEGGVKKPLILAEVLQMWLDRAEEIRSFAATVDGGYGRRLLLCVADDFERIAKESAARTSFHPGAEHNLRLCVLIRTY